MKVGVSIRIYDSPNVKELVVSTLRSYGNRTMRERGVDIAILGVDIAILGVALAILGVDTSALGVDIAILGVDKAILGVDIAILGVDIAILGVDIAIVGVGIANLRRREKKGGTIGGGMMEGLAV